MKRIFSANAFQLLMTALGLTLACTSCQKIDVPPTADGAKGQALVEKAAGNKPNTTPEVSLKLSISDAAGNKITSDGGGDYVNGSQNMRVVFDQSGNLIFDNKNVQGKPAVRFYHTNLDNPVQVVNDPGFTSGTGNYMASISSALLPFTPIQNMAIGTSQCITFHGGVGNGFIFHFHDYPEDISTSPTSFATVTRVSATVWTMSPSSCSVSTNSDVAGLRLSGVFYGYYHMPFAFTFTKQ
jgi:hypothetical protein